MSMPKCESSHLGGRRAGGRRRIFLVVSTILLATMSAGADPPVFLPADPTHDELVYGRYPRGEFKSSIEYELSMKFPDLGRTAVPKDVADGKALFSFEGLGERRVWKLPKSPTFADWYTNRSHPLKDGAGSTYGYATRGYVCQAEELLVSGRWKRYFGFLSKHGAAVVPAEDVYLSFPEPDPSTVHWTEFHGGLDWSINSINRRIENSRLVDEPCNVDRPIPIHASIRNRCGVARTMPGDLYRRLDDGRHSFRRGVRVRLQWAPYAPRNSSENYPHRDDYTDIPATYQTHEADPAKAVGPTLETGETSDVLSLDLREIFSITRPGYYHYNYEIDVKALGLSEDRGGSGIRSVQFLFGQPPPRLTLEQLNAEIGVLGGPGVEDRLRAIIDRDFQALPPDKPGAQPLPADFPRFDLGPEIEMEPEISGTFVELTDFQKAWIKNSGSIKMAMAAASNSTRVEFEKRIRAESNQILRLVSAVVAAAVGSREGALALLESMKSTDYATVLNTHSALSSALSLCSREEGAPDWIVELIIAVLSDERWVRSQGGRQGIFVRRVCALAQEDYLCLARDLGFKKCRKAVPFLLEKVRTSDVDGVYVDDLVYIGDPRAIPVLLECLEKLLQNMERNRDAYVYSEYDSIGRLIDATGAFKAREAVSLLTRYVDRLKAIKTLETIGDKRALPALRKLVEDKGVVLLEGKPVRPSDEQARCAYARIALATMEDGDSVERLCELLKDSSLTEHQRVDVVWRLSGRHDPRAVPVLVNMTRGGEGWYLADSSILALMRIPCPVAVDGLIACFDVQFPDKASFTKQVYHPADFHEDIARSLKTLTGQNLPPDKAAWEAWWKANRETFKFKDPK